MLDKEFLLGLFDEKNKDVSLEDKIAQIISEHESDTRGLVSKRDELLGSEKKLKEQNSALVGDNEKLASRVAEIEGELKKNSPEENKKYYDAQIEAKRKEYEESLAKISGERDFYKASHFERLKNDAVADGVKDLQFVDGLRDGFIARVMSMNSFEPREIDGKVLFLTKENKTIQEQIKSFALTKEGKAYIKNPAEGSGANSSTGVGRGKKTMTRQEFEDLRKANPKQVQEFFRNGGKLV